MCNHIFFIITSDWLRIELCNCDYTSNVVVLCLPCCATSSTNNYIRMAFVRHVSCLTVKRKQNVLYWFDINVIHVQLDCRLCINIDVVVVRMAYKWVRLSGWIRDMRAKPLEQTEHGRWQRYQAHGHLWWRWSAANKQRALYVCVCALCMFVHCRCAFWYFDLLFVSCSTTTWEAHAFEPIRTRQNRRFYFIYETFLFTVNNKLMQLLLFVFASRFHNHFVSLSNYLCRPVVLFGRHWSEKVNK